MSVHLKRILIFMMAITLVPAASFLLCLIALALDIIGPSIFSGATNFLFEEPVGIVLFLVSGTSLIVFSISAIVRRFQIERMKRIRYLTAAYLTDSRVPGGKRIYWGELSERIGMSERDVLVALQVMIERGEIKGRIDHMNGSYIHGSVTRKGKRLTMFLDADERPRYRPKVNKR